MKQTSFHSNYKQCPFAFFRVNSHFLFRFDFKKSPCHLKKLINLLMLLRFLLNENHRNKKKILDFIKTGLYNLLH